MWMQRILEHETSYFRILYVKHILLSVAFVYV